LINLPHPHSAKAYNESVKTLRKVVTDVTEEGIIVAEYGVYSETGIVYGVWMQHYNKDDFCCC
jgi:hypothetical protein